MILSSQWFKINDRWCIRPCINISHVFKISALIFLRGPIFIFCSGTGMQSRSFVPRVLNMKQITERNMHLTEYATIPEQDEVRHSVLYYSIHY